MSTASPLLQHALPSDATSDDTRALKHEVTHCLREHRQRRARVAEPHPVLPMEGLVASTRRSRVAESVAARFARTVSYREFLRAEAEAAMAHAAATAEVARRNAEAVASVQQELLQEIEQWSTPAEPPMLYVVENSASATQHAEPEAHVRNAPGPVDAAIPAATLSAPTASMMEELRAQAVSAEPAVPISANLIEFPRQLVASRRARPRHAEGPLREEADAAPERAQLRIFEVEASSISVSPVVDDVLTVWHDIRLDEPEPMAYLPETLRTAHSLAQPVYVAPVGLRCMAAIVDACCIAAAFLVALLAASYASPMLPGGLFAAIASLGALLVFSVLYLLLFFTLDDATPGMRYARIGFCTLDDENPSRASIRRRVVALSLAVLPLGLGVLWMCLDEDGLGWHDRISRMYPRAY